MHCFSCLRVVTSPARCRREMDRSTRHRVRASPSYRSSRTVAATGHSARCAHRHVAGRRDGAAASPAEALVPRGVH
jgi:hypothetical protein